MPITTVVEVVGDDAVIVKRAAGGDQAIESLRRQGERLRRASHPGVVSVLRSAPALDGWELVLAHGGRALSTLRRPTVPQVAGIAASVSATLADLHHLGIVHGRIDPSHVLIGDNGRPLLCGFGDGRDAAQPEDDVAALGRLLQDLLGDDETPEPIPDRRWRPGRKEWAGWERRALLGLADQATADETTRRPTARRLAAAIIDTIPTGDRGHPSAIDITDGQDPLEQLRPPIDEPGERRSRPGVAIGMASVAAVLVVVAAAPRILLPGHDRPLREPIERAVGVRTAEPVAGSVLVDRGKRYLVGQEGDHLLVDDWRCDGHPTPAVFRPTTHEVFIFDGWTTDAPISIKAATTVAESVAMIGTPGADGCPALSVRTDHGDLVSIPLEALR